MILSTRLAQETGPALFEGVTELLILALILGIIFLAAHYLWEKLKDFLHGR